MPRQQVKKTYFTFVGGLNTEAGYITFPPNQWKEGVNVIPQIDGSLHLRTAVNYESGSQLSAQLDTTAAKEQLAYGSHEWDNVQGSGGTNYIVVQRGRFLHFYENIGAATSTTELASTFIIDLNDYKSTNYPLVIGSQHVQCASANGKLLVVSPGTEPFLVEAVSGDTEFTVTVLTLRFRDFEGDVTDANLGNAVDTNPATLSNAHKYNLFNQGWRGTHIDSYFTSQSSYPSNAQQWFVGKDASDDFSAALLVKQEFGKSRAPQGHFLLDMFYRDRAAVSGVPGLTIEDEFYRPGAVEFFAGRAWYAGVGNSTKIGSWVMFSQTGMSNDKFANCYQDADPTSEQQSDLVDTDGGIIPIHGAGAILKLLTLDRALLVFADNGVWSIAGPSDSGFSATSFEVTQITAVGCAGARAVGRVENSAVYWSKEGVWSIGPGQTGLLEAKNLSDKSIDTFYNEINALSKEHAVMRYHAQDKKVYWLYLETPNADTATDRFLKDKLLVLDVRLGAFYHHTITPLAANSPYVLDAIITKGRSNVATAFDVILTNLDTVVNTEEQQVVETFDVATGSTTILKFLTIVPTGTNFTVTFSEFEDGSDQVAKFKDWFAKDGVGIGYVGHIMTGYDIGAGQGGDRKLQANYITALMKRTETGVDAGGVAINEGSVKLTTRWHFADSAVSNKWSTTTELYRHRRVFIPPSLPAATFDDGVPVLVVKHKMRGRGNAFQMKFESTLGKDFKLIGWSIPVLSNVD